MTLAMLLLTGSVDAGYGGAMRARIFTRKIEFQFAGWMTQALVEKLQIGSLASARVLGPAEQREIVDAYVGLTVRAQQLQNDITSLYADPEILDHNLAAAELLDAQSQTEQLLTQVSRLSEAVIQQQVNQALAERGFDLGGQILPPALYKVTELPLALIISPRQIIQQDANISLLPDLTLEEITELEQQVEQKLGVSALVVRVGGVGVYPTMVYRSYDLSWLVDTVAHEWAHNYLTLRPLGILYDVTPGLRTMNETAASIVGEEIGQQVLREYYPEWAAAVQPAAPYEELYPPASKSEPPVFDFNGEMHKTRLHVDELLAAGQIEEAEAYMEARRVFSWENGYQIRRLNQAYFAFYGAYADGPRGAFGSDPVGPLVRGLRIQARSLEKFLNEISWMTDFKQLIEAVR